MLVEAMRAGPLSRGCAGWAATLSTSLEHVDYFHDHARIEAMPFYGF
jgi:hypothetical protein